MLVEGEGKKTSFKDGEGEGEGDSVPASPASVDTQYSEASEIKSVALQLHLLPFFFSIPPYPSFFFLRLSRLFYSFIYLSIYSLMYSFFPLVYFVFSNISAAKVRGVSWTGRTDTNKRVVFPSQLSSPVLSGLSKGEAAAFAALRLQLQLQLQLKDGISGHGGNAIERSDLAVESKGKEAGREWLREGEGDRIEGQFTGNEVRGSGRGSAEVVSEGIRAVADLVRTLQGKRDLEDKQGVEGREEGEGGRGEGRRGERVDIVKGSYVVVKILSARGHTLR